MKFYYVLETTGTRYEWLIGFWFSQDSKPARFWGENHARLDFVYKPMNFIRALLYENTDTVIPR